MSARHSAQDAPSAAESHARRSLLARIHCLRRDAGWSEDEYRDILQGRTGKRSAADLDFAALGKVIDQLAPLVASQVKARAAHDWAFIDKASAEKRPLLRKVFAVCRALGAGRRYAEGIAKRQSGGVARRLEMMSYEELHKLVAALVNTQRSKAAAAAKAAATTPAGAQP